jgi:hypothetical protein
VSAASGGGRDAAWYSDMGQRQTIEQATGQSIVTDMDENFAGLGPVGPDDVLAADRSKFTFHGMGVRGAGPNAIAKQRAAEDAAKRMEELRRNIADLEALGSAQPLPPSVAGEVDPFSRTPYRYGTRSPECPNQNRHTRAKHRGLGIRCCQA